MLVLTLIIPIITAVALLMRPQHQARSIALTGSLLALAASLIVWMGFDFSHSAEFQFANQWTIVPAMGINLSLGIDAIALFLILLATFLTPLAILGSFTAVTSRVREFYFWILVLQTAMTAVFSARDLVAFYIAFEFTLIPMYFLIAVYGSTNRARAATVFFLYTFTGSIITLVGLLYVGYAHAQIHGQWTFDIAALVQTASSLPPSTQGWILLALCCGFAVKVPLFPVHTWLPLAHTEAPTAGSVILAAVLLKLGTYGLLRFALPMCPDAILTYAPFIAILCIIGIIYAALVCWVQRDVKKLIAYSSVSHLGFCVLGLVALNNIGISGSFLYMINHGLSTGALFLCIGMVYERFHTRSIDEFGGLARRMPVWTTFTIFFVMASVGLPGLNGFVGEFMTILGAFVSGQTSGTGQVTPGTLGPWYASVAAVGMILAAIYLLYFAGTLVFGQYHHPFTQGSGHDHSHGAQALPRDLSLREITVLAPLAIVCLALGVAPGIVLDPIADSVSDTVTHIAQHQTRTVDLAAGAPVIKRSDP